MTEKQKKSFSFSFKKELRDWGIILSIFGILYLTGLHTEVIGKLQSVLLYTGLMQPDTESAATANLPASYNMDLTSLQGHNISLGDFEGKTVFINFWATWCPPCIAEMPNIQSLYEQKASDDLVFVMISLDQERQKARDFIARKEYTFPVYFMNGYRPRVYQSEYVPTTFVLSPDGRIVLRHEGMSNYNTSDFNQFLDSLSTP